MCEREVEGKERVHATVKLYRLKCNGLQLWNSVDHIM